MTGPTVAEVGERALIGRLRAKLPAPPPSVVLGIGDDAAAVEPPRGALEVLTTDTIVEGIHFDARYCDPADVGHKALAVNVSDLAAMGAEPRLMLLSLGLPAATPVDVFDQLVDGVLEEAARHRVTLVGGNITRSPGPWFVDVTAIGTARRRRLLSRAGGRPGDELYVTGRLGAARAGLAWLQRAADIKNGQSDVDGSADAALAEAVRRYLRPEPRVRIGVQVARNRAASACMDLSDGLADAVTQVADASGTGAEVDEAALPCHPALPILWGGDAGYQALLGGDDYELLFAVPPRRRRAFVAATRRAGSIEITKIGRLTPPREGLRLRRADGSEASLPRGYEHFI